MLLDLQLRLEFKAIILQLERDGIASYTSKPGLYHSIYINTSIKLKEFCELLNISVASLLEAVRDERTPARPGSVAVIGQRTANRAFGK